MLIRVNGRILPSRTVAEIIESRLFQPKCLVCANLLNPCPSSPRSDHSDMASTTDDELPSATPVTPPTADDNLSPPCSHEACNHPNYCADAAGFRTMTATQRISIVRCILYATGVAAEAEVCSELLGDHRYRTDLRKRRTKYKQAHDCVAPRGSFVYAMRGRKLCRDAFANLVGLNANTITRHAKDVTMSPSLLLYETRHNESHTGKLGIQRRIVDGFLGYVSSTYGLECPSGRGSAAEAPLMVLPSEMTRMEVYAKYVDKFDCLWKAVAEECGGDVRRCPLSFSAFTRCWDKGHPTLKVAKRGSDFCDFCVTMQNDIEQLHPSDERHECLSELLRKHKDAARAEHDFYKTLLTTSRDINDGSCQHVVFDFAEKVLLPQLLKQPGQLYYVTGLKFDIFGVHDSNQGETYIFGLPEGHWPNEKNANTVISMLHYAIEVQMVKRHLGSAIKTLRLHADNCAGQNKNRFVLFYLCWRTLMGLNEEVSLYFMVAGHTKNIVDGAFGHIKRHLKSNEARCPSEMMSLIETSSSSTVCVPSARIGWILWKDFLDKLFKMPSGFMITKFQAFRFCAEEPGMIFAKEFSGSEREQRFQIVRRGVELESIRAATVKLGASVDFKASIAPLVEVQSAQQGTRHGYLVHNVVNRYYAEDAVMQKAFFDDGTAGVTDDLLVLSQNVDVDNSVNT